MEPLSFFMGMLACALALRALECASAWIDRRVRISAARRRAGCLIADPMQRFLAQARAVDA